MTSLDSDDILAILSAFGRSGFTRLELTVGTSRLSVSRESVGGAQLPGAGFDIVPIVAPVLGIFQVAPTPDEPPFVQSGVEVQSDTTIGLLRVMQDLIPVKSGLSGKVVEVLRQEGELVEFGQTVCRVAVARSGFEDPRRMVP